MLLLLELEDPLLTELLGRLEEEELEPTVLLLLLLELEEPLFTELLGRLEEEEVELFTDVPGFLLLLELLELLELAGLLLIHSLELLVLVPVLALLGRRALVEVPVVEGVLLPEVLTDEELPVLVELLGRRLELTEPLGLLLFGRIFTELKSERR